MGKRRDRRSRQGIDPSAGIRVLRLEQLYREELNSILDGELGDERFVGVRISFVELSRDGSRARIWYTMRDDCDAASSAATADAFARAATYFRARLCDALPLKRCPELSFRRDPAALGIFEEEMR